MGFGLKTLTLTSIAIASLGLTSVVTPVHPREKGECGRRSANVKEDRHCVTDLSKPDTPTTCFDTFTAAIAAATGGQITDAPADSEVAMNDERFVARVYNTGDKKREDIQPRPFGVMGTIFSDYNYKGRSQTYYGPACTSSLTDIDRDVPYVGDTWNDKFRSFKSGKYCDMKVWENPCFSGVHTNFSFAIPDLGVLADEGSALQFT